MFDPTRMLANGRLGYIKRHEGCDYYAMPPLKVRANPLRLEIGIGLTRPCALIINKKAWMHRIVADFLFRIRRAGKPQ